MFPKISITKTGVIYEDIKEDCCKSCFMKTLSFVESLFPLYGVCKETIFLQMSIEVYIHTYEPYIHINIYPCIYILMDFFNIKWSDTKGVF